MIDLSYIHLFDITVVSSVRNKEIFRFCKDSSN